MHRVENLTPFQLPGAAPVTSTSALQLVAGPQFDRQITFAYRNNVTFERILPLVEQQLAALGYRITRVPLPAEFQAQQLTEALQSLRSSMIGTTCFLDNTLTSLSPADLPPNEGASGVARRSVTLDAIMFGATYDVVTAQDGGGILQQYSRICQHSEDPAGYQTFQKDSLSAIQRILSRALNNKPVDLVTIFPHHLDDHLPFRHGPKDADAGEILGNVFQAMGFAAQDIIICRDFKSFDFDRLSASKFSVCLGDRHLLTGPTLDNNLAQFVGSYLFNTPTIDAKNIRSQMALLRSGIALYRELLGLQKPEIDDDLVQGKRYWLRLPMEDLYGSIFSQGLVMPGDCEHTDALVSAVTNRILENL